MKEKNSFVKEILQDPKIFIIGTIDDFDNLVGINLEKILIDLGAIKRFVTAAERID